MFGGNFRQGHARSQHLGTNHELVPSVEFITHEELMSIQCQFSMDKFRAIRRHHPVYFVGAEDLLVEVKLYGVLRS